MRIQLTFKTPDVAESALQHIESEEKREEIKEQLALWIKYGEYVTIDFDLADQSAVVLKCGGPR